jgi:hypothetical protein
MPSICCVTFSILSESFTVYNITMTKKTSRGSENCNTKKAIITIVRILLKFIYMTVSKFSIAESISLYSLLLTDFLSYFLIYEKGALKSLSR